MHRDQRKLWGGDDCFYYLFLWCWFHSGVCVCGKLCRLLYVYFISIGLLKIQIAPPKQHCTPFPQHPPRLSLRTLVESVEIIAGLLILCAQHSCRILRDIIPPPRVSCYSVNLFSIPGAARLLLKPQTIPLLLLLFYFQIKDDI